MVHLLIIVSMGNNPCHRSQVYLRWITCYSAFNHEIITVYHYLFSRSIFPSLAARCAVAATLASTIAPIQTTRFLAEKNPNFELVAFLAKSPQIFICYRSLLLILQRMACENSRPLLPRPSLTEIRLDGRVDVLDRGGVD